MWPSVLASYTQHNVSQLHPCCSPHPHFFLFQGWMVFQCATILHLLISSGDGTWVISIFGLSRIMLLWMFAFRVLCEQFSVSLGECPGLLLSNPLVTLTGSRTVILQHHFHPVPSIAVSCSSASPCHLLCFTVTLSLVWRGTLQGFAVLFLGVQKCSESSHS